jgi:hypothetical protein
MNPQMDSERRGEGMNPQMSQMDADGERRDEHSALGGQAQIADLGLAILAMADCFGGFTILDLRITRFGPIAS